MIASLIVWGCLTGWWNMAGLAIVLVVCIAVLFGEKARLIRDIVIVFVSMIPILESKIQILDRFNNELEEEAINAVALIEDQVKDIVTEEQLFRGIDGEGKKIRPFYTATTIRIKLQKNQPVNRVTLRDTGAFYDSIILLYGDTEFRVFATNEKRAKLQKKYGDDILGMNENSRDILSEKIKPVLINELRKKVV